MLVPNAPTLTHQSLAESVLAQAQAAEGAPEGAPDVAPAEEGGSGDPAAPAEGGNGKLSWEEAVKRVPPNVATLMRKMQADYTKKTQELSTQRKELQQERESLLKMKVEVPTDLGEYDPFNEGSITKRIEAEVAKRMKELLEPMQQEAELLKAENDYSNFLSENPDFMTNTGLRSEVQSLLEANPALDLTTAYWAAKGKQAKLGKAAPVEGRGSSPAARQAAKEAAAVIAPSRRAPPPSKPDRKTLATMSNADILALAATMVRS